MNTIEERIKEEITQLTQKINKSRLSITDFEACEREDKMFKDHCMAMMNYRLVLTKILSG